MTQDAAARAVTTQATRGAGIRSIIAGSPYRAINWGFVGDRVLSLSVPVVFVVVAAWRIAFFVAYPWILGLDGRLYYDATAAWVAGGDPWAAQELGVYFAAPPPALLLNLPLLPFGRDFAGFFWPLASVVAMALAVRHYRLPAWWMLFPPFLEGALPGSPDVVLLGAAVIGAGAIAAAAKPYAIFGLLGERRWRALAGGIILVAVTLPLLPWSRFLGNLPSITTTLAQQSHSAIPVAVWLVTAIALASLGVRRALLLAAPALWPSPQPHYALFSIKGIRASRLLALGFAIPGAVPVAIIGYAVMDRFGGAHRQEVQRP